MALVESFSGIRGIYGKELTESVTIRYAHAYCTFLRKKHKKKNVTVVVGMDTRPSGPKLKESVLGLIDCNFIDVGILPTPAIESAVRHFEADGGIIITASHNEPCWNGFKFLSSDGGILTENEMDAVIKKSKSLKDFHKIQERRIIEKNQEAVKAYSNFLFDVIGSDNIKKIKNSKLKVVIDPNGGAGAIAKKILEECGVNVIGINMNYGEFNRKVEPAGDAVVYLKNFIDENKADFAAAFDCDADRVEIMMKNGELMSGNCILALVVNEILSQTKNPKKEFVVVNDATSNVVRDIAEKFGAKIMKVEVGETNVIEGMKKLKSAVGGEGSSGGAIISPSRCRDGIMTLLAILSLIAKKGKNIEEIIDELPKYYSLRAKLEFNADKHDSIKKFIKNYYTKKGFKFKETGGTKGGLKVIINKNSFVWFRASKTESNVFRIISDSNKKEDAQKLLDEAVKSFGKANESN